MLSGRILENKMKIAFASSNALMEKIIVIKLMTMKNTHLLSPPDKQKYVQKISGFFQAGVQIKIQVGFQIIQRCDQLWKVQIYEICGRFSEILKIFQFGLDKYLFEIIHERPPNAKCAI